jgi:glycosyltransferase involved in cell wall biosynthesis
MTEPLVTIGLPVYNSDRYVKQSLDSLLAQTYGNFVLVISDNASTDNTAGICRDYAERDARIRYFRNATNIGNPRNFNRVFELTTTRYLKWSTSDDFWEATFLERAVEVMERDPGIALCYPKAWLVDASGGNPRPFDDVLHLMQDDPAERFTAVVENIRLAHQHLGLIRTAHLRQTHLLGIYVASDITLLAELSLYGKFYELSERLFFRRFHETSGSWKRDDQKHQAQYYYGTSGSRQAALPRWRCYAGLYAAVRSSPLPLKAKSNLYGRLAKRMMWNRRELARELLAYTRSKSR